MLIDKVIEGLEKVTILKGSITKPYGNKISVETDEVSLWISIVSYGARNEIHITSVSVSEEYQNTGIFTSILHELKDICVNSDAKLIIVNAVTELMLNYCRKRKFLEENEYGLVSFIVNLWD